MCFSILNQSTTCSTDTDNVNGIHSTSPIRYQRVSIIKLGTYFQNPRRRVCTRDAAHKRRGNQFCSFLFWQVSCFSAILKDLSTESRPHNLYTYHFFCSFHFLQIKSLIIKVWWLHSFTEAKTVRFGRFGNPVSTSARYKMQVTTFWG